MFVSYCLVNLGFTFVDRICIDADKLNIWQISVPHKILLFQPFLPSVTCFLQCFLMASSLLKYITSFYKVHTRARHIVYWDWLCSVASIISILICVFFVLLGKLQES